MVAGAFFSYAAEHAGLSSSYCPAGTPLGGRTFGKILSCLICLEQAVAGKKA